MVLEAYVIVGSLVIFLTENNIPKSMMATTIQKHRHDIII